MRILLYIFITGLLLSAQLFAQEVDIVPALKKVEAGEIEAARQLLKEFKQSQPTNPSVMFLDAVLTDNGEDALFKYERVYKKYPKSQYADASVYRIFSYYFALGIYKKAETYKQLLLSKYPHSPYVKAANRNIPDIELDNSVTQTTRNIDDNSQSSNKFTVQAGAFLNIANAKKLLNNLSAQGYAAEITAKDIGGAILNVVTAGKFSSKAEARNFLNFLKSDYHLNGRIISIKN